MCNVFAARTMAAFAADVPLSDLLGVNVVADGMAAVASRAGRSFHVVRRIKIAPPIRARTHEVLAPLVILDLPLDREREIVVADLGEVTLLPNASVNECHLLARERRNRVGG